MNLPTAPHTPIGAKAAFAAAARVSGRIHDVTAARERHGETDGPTVEASTLRKRRASERQRRFRERQRAGRRLVSFRAGIEIAPGLFVQQIEIDEATVESVLVECGALRPVDCDSQRLVDEAIARALMNGLTP